MVHVLSMFGGLLEDLVICFGAGLKVTIKTVISTSNEFHGNASLCVKPKKYARIHIRYRNYQV
jgi:hypothetical protein